VIGWTALYAVAVATAYFALQLSMQTVFGAVIPETIALRGPFALAVEIAVVGAFTAVTLLQGRVPGDKEQPRWRTLYALVWNGFYVNTFLNRLLMATWPGRAGKP